MLNQLAFVTVDVPSPVVEGSALFGNLSRSLVRIILGQDGSPPLQISFPPGVGPPDQEYQYENAHFDEGE